MNLPGRCFSNKDEGGSTHRPSSLMISRSTMCVVLDFLFSSTTRGKICLLFMDHSILIQYLIPRVKDVTKEIYFLGGGRGRLKGFNAGGRDREGIPVIFSIKIKF